MHTCIYKVPIGMIEPLCLFGSNPNRNNYHNYFSVIKFLTNKFGPACSNFYK